MSAFDWSRRGETTTWETKCANCDGERGEPLYHTGACPAHVDIHGVTIERSTTSFFALGEL